MYIGLPLDPLNLGLHGKTAFGHVTHPFNMIESPGLIVVDAATPVTVYMPGARLHGVSFDVPLFVSSPLV
jgi:hypothetical protein